MEEARDGLPTCLATENLTRTSGEVQSFCEFSFALKMSGITNYHACDKVKLTQFNVLVT